MGIKRAYERIDEWRKQIFHIIHIGGCSEEAVTRHQTLGEVLDIIKEECPEVKSVENQTQFKRNSNAISDIHMDVLTILDSLPVVDNYEIALEGLMNAESDDEEIDEYLEEIQDESQTHEEFIESLDKLLYLLEKKEESNERNQVQSMGQN